MSASQKHKADNQSSALGVVTIPPSSDPGFSRLERLPYELLGLITDLLNKGDLVSLICTSQRNHLRVKPILNERKLTDAYHSISIKHDDSDWASSGYPIAVIDRLHLMPILCRFVEHFELNCLLFFRHDTNTRHSFYHDESIRDSVTRYKFLASLVNSLDCLATEEVSQLRREVAIGHVTPAFSFLLTMLPNLTELTLWDPDWRRNKQWMMMMMIKALRQGSNRTPDDMTADGRILVIDQPKVLFPSIVTLSICSNLITISANDLLPLLLIPTLKRCQVTKGIVVSDRIIEKEVAHAWPQGESKSCMLETLEIAQFVMRPRDLVTLVQGMTKLENFNLKYATGEGNVQLAHGHRPLMWFRNAHKFFTCLKDHYYDELQREQPVLDMTCDGEIITMTYSKNSE